MRSFLKKIEKYHYMLVEAEDAPPPPPDAVDDTTQSPTPQETQQSPEAEPQSLSPESEVMLIRLLKKAFVLSPKPEDVEFITQMDDINENNARENLTNIVNLIKKYSSDVDIKS